MGKTILIVNSTEWRNLCARGILRISKRRPTKISESSQRRDLRRAFAVAPTTNLESSVDLLVLELIEDWEVLSQKHVGAPNEVITLPLSAILLHHPVSSEHLNYYRDQGSSCGVDVADAIYEDAWIEWVMSESVSASIVSATELEKAFGISFKPSDKRGDKYRWEDLARLTLRPSTEIRRKPGHVDLLLKTLSDISFAIASTIGLEQFYLATAIEWVDHRLGKDPLAKRVHHTMLQSALDMAKAIPIDSPDGLSQQTKEALTHLALTFPKAFTDELTPISLSLIARLLIEAKSHAIKPHTAISMIQSMTGNGHTERARLAIFLLAVELGPELSKQLATTLERNAVPVSANFEDDK